MSRWSPVFGKQTNVSENMNKNGNYNEDNQNDTLEDIPEAEDKQQDNRSQSEPVFRNHHNTKNEEEYGTKL